MKNAIIIYQSKKGTTALFANMIKQFLRDRDIKAISMSVEACNDSDLSNYDYVFLGCWTKGLMVLNQHPDEKWVKLARSLKFSGESKIVLFTSYKVMTGSMFSRMRKYLSSRNVALELKSKDGYLHFSYANLLEDFLHSSGGYVDRRKPSANDKYKMQIS